MKGDECKSRQQKHPTKNNLIIARQEKYVKQSSREERNMFESEYENPMVLGGNYGEEDSPDQEVRCPHCGRIWNGYDTDCGTEWDCTDYAYASAFIYPVMNKVCRVCAFDERTIEQERAYIADRELHVDVLEYLLCRSTGRITHYDNAEALWDVLIDTEDDRTRSWVNDLIHSFIGEEAESDFVDWIMEGGFDRVRDGNQVDK